MRSPVSGRHDPVDAAWVDVLGVRIQAPVAAGTNVALALQCAYFRWRLRRGVEPAIRLWALFFLAMAVATLAGAPKHALRHVLSPIELTSVLWISSLGSGLAVWAAQRATITSRAGLRRVGLERASSLQLVAYLVANAAWGPHMSVLIANTVVGLLPVIHAEAGAARGGEPSGGWIAAGFGLSMITGLVYVAELSLGHWVNHIDVAHVLMALSYYLIARGAAAPTSVPVLATRHGEVYL
jgi:hypothetical protein